MCGSRGGEGALNDLIDTTEMYLRTIFELLEEDIVPLRARIAERLGQSGPTVSQTVARMERDGLVVLTDDRQLEFTDEGKQRAIAVMRKHRLAERLLHDVIGLDWPEVHVEACRWEHVMSEQVEKRLVALLDAPRTSPYGNPIPGLDQLGVSAASSDSPDTTAAANISDLTGSYTVSHIIEVVQNQPEIMTLLQAAAIAPGTAVSLARNNDDFTLTTETGSVTVTDEIAAGIYLYTH